MKQLHNSSNEPERSLNTGAPWMSNARPQFPRFRRRRHLKPIATMSPPRRRQSNVWHLRSLWLNATVGCLDSNDGHLR